MICSVRMPEGIRPRCDVMDDLLSVIDGNGPNREMAEEAYSEIARLRLQRMRLLMSGEPDQIVTSADDPVPVLLRAADKATREVAAAMRDAAAELVRHRSLL